MESISPNIFIKNIDETIKFYEKLEFKLSMKVPEEGNLVWAMMTKGNVSFMFQTFESLGNNLPEISRQDGGSLLLYIQIKEIRQYHDRIKDKVNILKGLEKTFYGATEFSIQDINGYVLTFAENEV
ncbi:MAG: VOC family protein [Salibacteraceae bacterium]